MEHQHLHALAALVLAAFTLCACGDRGKGSKLVYEMPEREHTVYSTPEYTCDDTVMVEGQACAYSIRLHSCDTLPRVTDFLGDEAVDNVAELSLSRGGNRYFHRTLTKSLFRDSLDADFYRTSILDGMRFLRTTPTGRGVTFCATVSEPGNDMFVTFVVTAWPDGRLTFRREDIDDEM